MTSFVFSQQNTNNGSEVEIDVYPFNQKSQKSTGICLLWECFLEHTDLIDNVSAILDNDHSSLHDPKTLLISDPEEKLVIMNEIKNNYGDGTLKGDIVAHAIAVGSPSTLFKIFEKNLYRDPSDPTNERPHSNIYFNILKSNNLSLVEKINTAQKLLQMGCQLDTYFKQIFFSKDIKENEWETWIDMGMRAKAICELQDDMCVDWFIQWKNPKPQLQWIKINTNQVPKCLFHYKDSAQRCIILTVIESIWGTIDVIKLIPYDRLTGPEGNLLPNAIKRLDWTCAKYIYDQQKQKPENLQTYIYCVYEAVTMYCYIDFGSDYKKFNKDEEILEASRNTRQWVFEIYGNIIEESWKEELGENFVDLTACYSRGCKIAYDNYFWMVRTIPWFAAEFKTQSEIAHATKIKSAKSTSRYEKSQNCKISQTDLLLQKYQKYGITLGYDRKYNKTKEKLIRLKKKMETDIQKIETALK